MAQRFGFLYCLLRCRVEKSIYPFNDTVHIKLSGQNLDQYLMNITKCLADEDNKAYIRSEMLIESLWIGFFYAISGISAFQNVLLLEKSF